MSIDEMMNAKISEHAQRYARMVEYIQAMGRHHRVVYLDRQEGTDREQNMRRALQTRWAAFDAMSQQTVMALIHKAFQKPSVAAFGELPATERALFGMILHDLGEVRTQVLHRTRMLIARRLMRGENAPFDRTIPDSEKLFEVERIVPDLTRYAKQGRDVFVDNYVKVGIHMDSSDNRPYEYVWVEDVELYEEQDHTIDEPDELGGTIVEAPARAQGFVAGTPITFKVTEIQDAWSCAATGPDDTGAKALRALGVGPSPRDCLFSDVQVRGTWDRMSWRERQHILQFHETLRVLT